MKLAPLLILVPGDTTTVRDCNPYSHLPETRSDKLDMDHVYLPFIDFLWASTFVFPNSLILAIYGVMSLKLKDYAIKIGVYK